MVQQLRKLGSLSRSIPAIRSSTRMVTLFEQLCSVMCGKKVFQYIIPQGTKYRPFCWKRKLTNEVRYRENVNEHHRFHFERLERTLFLTMNTRRMLCYFTNFKPYTVLCYVKCVSNLGLYIWLIEWTENTSQRSLDHPECLFAIYSCHTNYSTNIITKDFSDFLLKQCIFLFNNLVLMCWKFVHRYVSIRVTFSH